MKPIPIALLATVALIFIGILFVSIPVESQAEPIINVEKKKQPAGTAMKELETQNALEKYSIDVVGGSAPDFDARLLQYVGNIKLRSDEISNLAKPLSVLVFNRSKKDVVGCSLRWTFSRADGREMVFPQIQSSPGVLMGMQPIDPKMQGKTSLISAGGVKLFSFDYGIEQIFDRARLDRSRPPSMNASADYSFRDEISNSRLNRNNLLGSFVRFSVSVDGIFFSDGTFVGPDKFFFFDSMVGRVQARKDLLAILLKSSRGRLTLSQDITAYVSKNMNFKTSERQVPDDKESAFRKGYQSYARSLAEEISNRRSIETDKSISDGFLRVDKPGNVTLKKLE
ncbi:MAG: hypothetical protein ABIV48_02590 [Pyrinomonadaceae bacterium]